MYLTFLRRCTDLLSQGEAEEQIGEDESHWEAKLKEEEWVVRDNQNEDSQTNIGVAEEKRDELSEADWGENSHNEQKNEWEVTELNVQYIIGCYL